MTSVGILETGQPQATVLKRHGDYGQMFRTYFADFADLDFTAFAISTGGPIPAPAAKDAWIVTGSESAVYEDHPWLPSLREFVRQTVGQGLPTLGICFGHQLMAQALGGQVAKSDKGRGIGIHRYDLTEAGQWLAPGTRAVHLIASHQDQVIEAPPGAVVLAGSAFCPNAALAYGASGLSFQPHPEYTIDAARATARLWQERAPVPEDVWSAGEATYNAVVPDSARLAPLLHAFLARPKRR